MGEEVTHIKELLARTLEHASKAKFYRGNRDIFIKYFDNSNQYDALILAGNFDKLEGIIRNNKFN